MVIYEEENVEARPLAIKVRNNDDSEDLRANIEDISKTTDLSPNHMEKLKEQHTK